MAAISETLRQARIRSGIDLDDLAAKTKINPRYLRAIETGEFDKLPGGIFARMFIKQYADALGLDGASFAEEYQRDSQSGSYSAAESGTTAVSRVGFHPSVRGLSSAGEQVRQERLTSALSSLIWVVAAILVCAGAYYVLAHLPSRHSEVTAATAPAKPPAPVKPPAAVAQPQGGVAGNGQATEKRSGTGGAPPQEQALVPQEPAEPIQLTLNATEEAWVTATADGKTIMSEVMKPGDSKIISAAKGARITLGNAGGVVITFNGKKLEPFGPKGQVRTVDFTSWGAQVVSRTPPSPDPLL